MTRNEHDALQQLFNTSSAISEERDRVFKELQELSYKVSGNRWCNAERNLQEILEHGSRPSILQAKQLQIRYHEYCGQLDALSALGSTLSELGFWKGLV